MTASRSGGLLRTRRSGPVAVEGGEASGRRVRPAVYDGRQYVAVAVFTLLVALLGPQVADTRAHQYLVNVWMIYAIAAIGFYWVFGLAGRFAFCQTFMMLLGGYTSAWVTRQGDGLPFFLGVIAAIVMTAVVAVVVGWLVRRAQEFYFAIATLAVTSIGLDVFTHAESFSGRNGTVSGVAPPSLFGHRFVDDKEIFWLFLAVLAIVLLLAAFLERSPLRRDAVAARSNALVANLAGVPVVKTQLLLFVLGSALGGVAGALFAHWNRVMASNTFGIDLAIGIFLMLFLGGVGSMWGPVVGAAFYVALPEFLSGIQRYNTIVYGLLLLVVVLALPEGLVGAANRVRAAIAKGRRSKAQT